MVRSPDASLKVVEVADVDEARSSSHDAHAEDPSHAFALSRLADLSLARTPIGVFRDVDRPVYDDLMADQLDSRGRDPAVLGAGGAGRAAGRVGHLDRVLTEARRGTLYGIAAYLIWGLFPLYWPLLEPAGAVEILAHRVVWCLVFVVLALTVGRSWATMRPLLGAGRTTRRLALAAVVIAANWTLYIWGVNHHHVVETSLGYFINPVVTVMIGVLVLRERLRPAQWVAIGLGLLAVVVLTVDYGRPPWIALGLAFSFATYGLIKKQVGATVGALQSLTVETSVLFVPALAYLVVLGARGDGQFGPAGVGPSLLLASGGRGHRRTAAVLRLRRPAGAALHARPAAVPHAGAAVAHRRPGLRRADAAVPGRGLRAGVGRPRRAVRRRTAPRPFGTPGQARGRRPPRPRRGLAGRRLSTHIGASS